MVTTKGLSEMATKSHWEGLDHLYINSFKQMEQCYSPFGLKKKIRIKEFVQMCPVCEG